MADNAQKIFLGRSLNQLAQNQAMEQIQKLGRSLPCSVTAVAGSIVTVKFEVNSIFTLPPVTCPMMGAEYIRYPIQVGCLGYVVPSDAYLGGVSGLGGGVADLSLPANLSALVFCPISNKYWSETDDPNATVIYGPNGVILRDQGSESKVILTPSGITLESGGHSVVINATGVIIDGRVFLAHEHTGVEPGPGITGGVV